MDGKAVNGQTATQGALNGISWNVEEVVAALAEGPPVLGSDTPIPFFHIVERLKTTKREGWRRFGISEFVSRNPALSIPH